MLVSVRRFKTAMEYNSLQLRKDAQKILQRLDYGDFSLNILLTNNDIIQKYNRDYRNLDEPTDILSFAFHEDLLPGEKIKACCDDEKHLGDLVISLEYTKNDAQNYGQTFEERMQTLLIHGVCHLRGYDHQEDEDYEIMQKEESRISYILKEIR